MAVVLGGYLCTSADVISRKEDKKPASIVSQSVNSVGKHIAPCRNTMRSAMVAYGVWRIAALEEPTICHTG